MHPCVTSIPPYDFFMKCSGDDFKTVRLVAALGSRYLASECVFVWHVTYHTELKSNWNDSTNESRIAARIYRTSSPSAVSRL